jgi:hypothetical protein
MRKMEPWREFHLIAQDYFISFLQIGISVSLKNKTSNRDSRDPAYEPSGYFASSAILSSTCWIQEALNFPPVTPKDGWFCVFKGQPAMLQSIAIETEIWEKTHKILSISDLSSNIIGRQSGGVNGMRLRISWAKLVPKRRDVSGHQQKQGRKQ